jgi:hypothetical protein
MRVSIAVMDPANENGQLADVERGQTQGMLETARPQKITFAEMRDAGVRSHKRTVPGVAGRGEPGPQRTALSVSRRCPSIHVRSAGRGPKL